jgi:hypothetical protein
MIIAAPRYERAQGGTVRSPASFSLPSSGFLIFFSTLIWGLTTQKKLQVNRLNYRIIGIISFAFLVLLPITVTAGIIFSVDYEDGTFGNVTVRTSEPGAGYASICCQPPEGHSAKIVTSPVRVGTKALKMTLTPEDEGYQYGSYKKPYYRAEFEKGGFDYIGLQRWYGTSIRIDPNWKDNVTSGTNDALVMQWHSSPLSGCTTLSPHLMISYTTSNKWKITSLSYSGSCPSSSTVTKRIWEFAGSKDVWVDWVVNVKWSTGSDGFLRVWKDGTLVIDHSGPTVQRAESTMRIKWGVYKARWATETIPPGDILVVYHDQIKIGDASSSYTEVAPTNSSSTVVSPLDAPSDLRTTVQ